MEKKEEEQFLKKTKKQLVSLIKTEQETSLNLFNKNKYLRSMSEANENSRKGAEKLAHKYEETSLQQGNENRELNQKLIDKEHKIGVEYVNTERLTAANQFIGDILRSIGNDFKIEKSMYDQLILKSSLSGGF